jgi:hypothetical protein
MELTDYDYQRLQTIADTFSFHKKHPEVSYEAHVQNCLSNIAKKIFNRTKIYLDQKYWNYFRDVKRNSPQKNIHCEIFKTLHSLVENKIAICPVSCSVLHETMKQCDKRSRIITAGVIDDLSDNISFLSPTELSEIEMKRYIKLVNSHFNEDFSQQSVWVPVSYTMGIVTPYLENISDLEMKTIQKAFFDCLSSRTFSDLIYHMPSHEELIGIVDDEKFTAMLNNLEKKHECDYSDYKNLLLCEICGSLDIEETRLYRAFEGYYSMCTICPLPWGHMKNSKTLVHFLMRLYRRGVIFSELPGVIIPALVHAFRRHRKAHRAKKGDRYDLEHTRMALPYCSAFFTDKAWGSLICQVTPSLKESYNCEILWDDNEILNYLYKITLK